MLLGHCPPTVIQLAPEKAEAITLVCCYLDNFMRKKSKHYLRAGSVGWEDANHEVHPTDCEKNNINWKTWEYVEAETLSGGTHCTRFLRQYPRACFLARCQNCVMISCKQI
ncbi:hypothetical protein PoB_007573700 [Plakobranchus ocellatus]|uniref:Uncharacterized protein n=1 Tax=Plakobranchus ocellatus TaxID=259542 RepID=A0AAV4DY04_9GAST|nr:hypothetical protein PoB_007573700 [Plakobranchus ocellatus]